MHLWAKALKIIARDHVLKLSFSFLVLFILSFIFGSIFHKYMLSLTQPWPQIPDPNNREARQQRFAHFTELAIISVQEIVDFAKQLPGFLELTREDQIALLKTSTIEVRV